MDKIEKNNKTFYELILNLPLTAEFLIYNYENENVQRKIILS
jgi:hypothetical protein